MRVLSVSSLIDPVSGGGTAARTAQLSRAMARAGMGVRLLATDAGMKSSRGAVDLGGATLTLLPSTSERFPVPRAGRGEIERYVSEADVIHLCNHWTLLNLLVQRVARRLGRPYVVCPAGALPMFGRSKWLKSGYNALGGRDLVQEAAAWVAITRRETADFAPYGVDPSRVEVIPNGIEPSDYEQGDARTFRERLRLGAARIILFVGRLNEIKGPDLLLDAFAARGADLASCVLVYAGPDGGMQASLERRSRERGVAARVRFAGWLGGADKVAAYRAAELVVVPSRQEAMSLVALEAGACGKPVLMSDRCGFDEAAASGGARAVPPAVGPLATELGDLMTKAPLVEMGERLRSLVLSSYTWDAAVERYAKLFERVVAGAR